MISKEDGNPYVDFIYALAWVLGVAVSTTFCILAIVLHEITLA